MDQTLNLIFQRLIENTSLSEFRYLFDSFSIENRLTGLVGARGVGKTTLLLQFIKKKLSKEKVFYFSADHIFFNSQTIYHFVEDLYLTEGIKIFFIDEIHKYKNWSQELKNLYDGFPDMKIIFSGSSSLDLVKGSYDLSRRAKMYSLPGLSFREYLNFEIHAQIEPNPLKTLLKDAQKLDIKANAIEKIKGHFQQYLRQGFYPFYRENSLSYYEKLLTIIDKTIYEDIANFDNFKTINLHHFKKILNFLASIPPGSTNIHNMSKNLSIDDKTTTHYLNSLNTAGLVHLVYPAEAGNSGLRRPEKIFLNNTNLQYAIEGQIANKIDIGNVRELFFVQSIKNAGHEVFHSKVGDYQIDSSIFEIGGKNKTRQQIKTSDNAYLVKDDLLLSSKGTIPLMHFGFLY